MTIGEFKRKSAPLLHSSQTPLLDLDLLIMAALGISREKLLIEQNAFEIPNNMMATLEGFVAEREKGVPVCYITGHKEFFGLDFIVTRDTLPPKPDTETLVEVTANCIFEKAKSKGEIIKVFDLCCGTGCVGLSVLHKIANSPTLPKVDLTMADISKAALLVAKENARRLMPKTFVHFIESNLFENITGNFDVIASNPPYIPHNEALELLKDGRSEPLLALDGGQSGLEVFFELVTQAKSFATTICVELSPQVMARAINFAKEKGYFVEVYKDLSGDERVITLKK